VWYSLVGRPSLLVLILLACSQITPNPQAPAAVTPAQNALVPLSTPRPHIEPTQLRISHAMITSSAGNYIAAEKGYFEEEGIQVEFVYSIGGTETMAFVVSGHTDIGAGLISAGLFNAFARNIPVKIVADHGANLPNASAGGMTFRKDLVDRGIIRQPGDLRGRKIAIATEGSAAHITLDRYLQAAGLTLSDVNVVVIPLPDTIAAFDNQAIEAAYWQEPFTTIAVERGLIIRGPIGFDIYPYQQIGGILFGPRMMADRPIGQRYMRAYVRGVRDYVKALQERDPVAFDEVVPILIKYTSVKDRALFEKAIPSGLKPDPIPNIQSLRDDQEWYLAHGYQTQRINIDDFVDTSFVEQAIRELGSYK